MTLSDLAALGSFVSGMAVLLSLALLYFQLRQIGAQIEQTEKNQRAMMSQGAIDRSAGLNTWISDHSPLFVKAILEPEQLSDADTFAMFGVTRNILLNFQDYYLQHKAGLADEITYNNAANSVRYFMAFPVFRALYVLRRDSYAPELTHLIDGMIEKLPPQPPISMAAELRSALDCTREVKSP